MRLIKKGIDSPSLRTQLLPWQGGVLRFGGAGEEHPDGPATAAGMVMVAVVEVEDRDSGWALGGTCGKKQRKKGKK